MEPLHWDENSGHVSRPFPMYEEPTQQFLVRTITGWKPQRMLQILSGTRTCLQRKYRILYRNVRYIDNTYLENNFMRPSAHNVKFQELRSPMYNLIS
jgi:hypothetical protein